jgi:type II secretory pathway component PulF
MMVVFMGFAVGFILISLFLPIYQLVQTF